MNVHDGGRIVKLAAVDDIYPNCPHVFHCHHHLSLSCLLPPTLGWCHFCCCFIRLSREWRPSDCSFFIAIFSDLFPRFQQILSEIKISQTLYCITQFLTRNTSTCKSCCQVFEAFFLKKALSKFEKKSAIYLFLSSWSCCVVWRCKQRNINVLAALPIDSYRFHIDIVNRWTNSSKVAFFWAFWYVNNDAINNTSRSDRIITTISFYG